MPTCDLNLYNGNYETTKLNDIKFFKKIIIILLYQNETRE